MPKTSTGTIAIQVEDYNDHCPELTATTQTMCFEDNVVYITAVDKDEFPNSAPFEFTVISGSSKGKWTVEHINGKDHSQITRGQLAQLNTNMTLATIKLIQTLDLIAKKSSTIKNCCNFHRKLDRQSDWIPATTLNPV